MKKQNEKSFGAKHFSYAESAEELDMKKFFVVPVFSDTVSELWKLEEDVITKGF